MTVSDRDAILAMRSPGDLFEAQDDPRELKRAYAVLAKRWRADAEASAHVRSLYEAARNPVRSDVPPRRRSKLR